MADQGMQKNPGGQQYGVLYDNNFSDLEGRQQQCKTLDEAWKALTSIRPKGATSDSPMTAQPIHDILAFLVSQMRDLYTRRGALHFPGLFPDAAVVYGSTKANDAQNHVHYVWRDGAWFKSTGAFDATQAEAYPANGSYQGGISSAVLAGKTHDTGAHEHKIDLGQQPCFSPIFWDSFKPPLPHDCYVMKAEWIKNLDVKFHVCQKPLKGTGSILQSVDLTNGAAVATAINTAIQAAGHQVWVGDWSSTTPQRDPDAAGRLPADSDPTTPEDHWPWGAGLGFTCYGNAAQVSDRFNLGRYYNWSSTYDIHLGWWLYKAFFAAIIDHPANTVPKTALSYAINPYGINFWPGDMSLFPDPTNPNDTRKNGREYEITDVAARWMGRDSSFQFDEFIKEQIWGKDGQPYSAATKKTYYERYVMALNRFNDWAHSAYAGDLLPPNVAYYKRFTADSRCHPTSCRVPLHIGYTITYTGTGR